MALYKCLNSDCENFKVPKFIQSDNEKAICPDCGATMMRLDLVQGKKSKGGTLKQIITLVGLVLTLALCISSCGGNNKKEHRTMTESTSMMEVALENNAQSLSMNCPQRYENGNTLESVTYKNYVFQYNYIVEGETFFSEGSEDRIKEAIKATFRGNNDNKPFVEALIKTNSLLVYHYRNTDGKTLDLKFDTNDLLTIFN